MVEKKHIFLILKTREYLKEIFAMNKSQDSLIDGVRAFSVLSIIAFHVAVGIIQVYDFDKSKNYILNMPSYLQPLWHGEKGVDAFFLISALVLGLPLFKKLDCFGWQSAKDFYRKRFFRIYPLFLVALVLYTIGQWSYFGKYFLTNLFLINNLIPGERTIIPVGWSLLVEVQYYALLPLLFIIIKTTTHKLKLLFILLGLSFLACAMRLINYPQLYKRPLTDIFLAPDRSEYISQLGELFYESNLTRFGPFVVGLILAYLKIKYDKDLLNFFNSKLRSFVVFTLGAVLVVVGIGLPLYHPESFYYKNFSANINFLVLISIRQAFAAGLALLMLGCWYSRLMLFKGLKTFFSLGVWLPISRLSFPIYLFHFPFIALAAVIVFGTTNVKEVLSVSFAQGVLIFALSLILTILFSIPLYVFIERPFIERAKKLSRLT